METYDPCKKHYTVIEELNIGCCEDGNYHIYSGYSREELIEQVIKASNGMGHQDMYVAFAKSITGLEQDKELKALFQLRCTIDLTEDDLNRIDECIYKKLN
jgi:hypothetical protein